MKKEKTVEDDNVLFCDCGEVVPIDKESDPTVCPKCKTELGGCFTCGGTFLWETTQSPDTCPSCLRKEIEAY
jgi:hypothetical protein